MSREIKFRIWCKGTSESKNFNKRRWIPLNDFILNKYFYSFDDIVSSEDFIVCQFTGLTDSRNREIYEGDILSYDGRDGYAEVKFGDGRFYLEGKNLTWIDLFYDKERW